LIVLAAIALLLPASALSSATIAVTNTSDGGPGSLREAIGAANANPGSTIVFAIPAADSGCVAGVCTIQPNTSLPSLTAGGTTIDGSTQGATNPLGPSIVVNGSLCNCNGIVLASDNNQVNDLVVNAFTGGGSGIEIRGSNNSVTGSYVGLDATGTVAVENRFQGISVLSGTGNVIGGSSPAERNVVSGNNGQGIWLASSGNAVRGNFIGTDRTGTLAVGNGLEGVFIWPCPFGNCPGGPAQNNVVGGSAPGEGNVISGNSDGVWIQDSANLVEGNFIGTDVSGTLPLGDRNDGVHIASGTANEIGGTAAEQRNIISGNGSDGINVGGGSSGESTGNLIQGNFIGTDATGAVAVPNGGSGVGVQGVDTVVGGTTAGARNVISGNVVSGVAVSGDGNGAVVEGNYIGTNAAGTSALGNALNNCNCDPHYVGVGVAGSSGAPSEVTIGGTAPGAGNLISGNGGPAVGLVNTGPTAITIQGNLLGTDASGAQEIPGSSGIDLFANVTHAVIGGTTAAARNIMGGVFVGVGSTGTVIFGNYIGTNAAGTTMVANQGQAIGLAPGSAGTVIGGTAPGAGNLIESGSGWPAVAISSTVSGTVIQGNLIGTDWTGTRAIASSSGTGTGIAIQGGDDSLIGGAAPGAANTIAFNGGTGVEVDAGTDNTISRNSIFSNGGLGIDLGGDGVTPNDPGDTDTGPNNLQNFPVLDSAFLASGQLEVDGTIDTPNPQSVTLEFFANAVPVPGGDPSGYGEGATFLGSAAPAANGTFSVTLPPVAPGTVISATATDAAGDTSEFAKDTNAATLTPTALCTLTRQDVDSSAKYGQLKPAARKVTDALVTAACQVLTNVGPKLRPADKAKFIAAYQQAVEALVPAGWLTQAQADVLKRLAGQL